MTSRPLEAAYHRLRLRIPPLERDRVLSTDIEESAEMVRTGVLAAEAASVCGTLE